MCIFSKQFQPYGIWTLDLFICSQMLNEFVPKSEVFSLTLGSGLERVLITGILSWDTYENMDDYKEGKHLRSFRVCTCKIGLNRSEFYIETHFEFSSHSLWIVMEE